MNKNLLIAAIAAMGVVSASAQTTVYLTGATAFRSAVNKSLFDDYGANLAATTGSSSTDDAAAALLFTNINVGGTTVDLSVKWSGSEAGIRTVASPSSNTVTDTFYSPSLVKALTGSFPKTAYALASANQTNARGDIAFSDTWQAVSNFQGKAKDNRTYATLNEAKVGVVPFTFVANKGCGIDNISLSTACQLAKAGRVPASIVTGITNDITGGAWFTGRDPFSGTRVTALMVGKVGYNTAIKNYKPTVSGGQITTLGDYASNAVSGLTVTAAGNGESSGGTLCGYMTNSMSASVSGIPVTVNGRGNTNILISYAGVADAVAKFSGGLIPLKFEGVHGRFGLTNEYSAANPGRLDSGYTNIISGKYPFWSYEHILWDSSRMSAAASNTLTYLTNTFASYATTNPLLAPNIALGDMKVYRLSDAGDIKYSTNAALYR
jgi:hypothetical protein